MINTFTQSIYRFVLLAFLLLTPTLALSQAKVVAGKNKTNSQTKQQTLKKANNNRVVSKAQASALREKALREKHPEEYTTNQASNIDDASEDEVVNGVPSVSQALKGIQQGRSYNLKKVLRDENGRSLLSGRQDNPILRHEYNFTRLADPKTGEIPDGIREKELDYVLSSKSRMQSNNSGLLKSSNAPFATPGTQVDPWVNRGPFNVGGRTRALAIDINDENRILAGGVSGGLWESTDQGASWSRITPALEHPSITDIVQDPRPGFQNIWYYSTGERLGASQSARNGSGFFQGNGIYISTDNAATFTPLASTINNTPEAFFLTEPFDLNFGVDIDPTNGNLYVATFAGIHRSTDLGATFELVLEGEFDNFSDIHITDTGVLYATLDSDNDGSTDASTQNGGIFRSTDGAAGTWTNITDPSFPATFGRTVVYTAPSNENVLYVYAAGTPSGPIGHDFWKYTYISGDGTGAGGQWENRTPNIPNFGGPVGDADTQGGYDIYVRVHPNDENIVFLGSLNIFRSLDGFATPIAQNNSGWIAGYSPLNNISLYTNHHPDQHSLEFFPSNPDMAISGHDGGLSITTDILASNAGGPASNEPVTWISANNGYLTTQVYALSIGPGDQIMAGFQDNSTWLTNSSNPQADWTDQLSGDGSYNAFNDDGTLRYLSAQQGFIVQRQYADADSNIPLSFQFINPVPNGGANFLFVAPFELDPNNDEIMYLATTGSLWRNDDLPNATQTVGWTELTNAPVPGGNISSIGISTSPANVVYYGTTTGSVVRIDNANVGNPTGVNVTGTNFPAGSNVSNIDVDPFNPNNVYVTFSNYSIPSIFFSNNGGGTWTDISGNLEENPDGSGSGPSVRWLNIVGDSDLFLVGTSTGLYSTQTIDGTNTTWTQVDPNGIGNVVVEQIRSRDDGLVVVGTHGNGLYSASFEVSAPEVIVNTPIPNQFLTANDPDLQIDVSNVFSSSATPPLPVTVTVESNSNTTLLSTNLSGSTLTISLVPDEFGDAVITLRGEDSGGAFALSSFNVSVAPPPINTYPYVQDFEGGVLPLAWETSGPFPWLINSGGTPSGGTGPLGDNTTGAGFYIYTEATGGAPGDQGFLLTRSLDLSPLTDPVVSFSYHMFGAGIGTLDLEVDDITNGTTTTIFNLTGPQQAAQGDPYLTTSVLDLSPFSGSIIQLRFIGTRGGAFTSDIAIDDVTVMERPADDIGVTDIIVSNDPFFGTNETVQIEITNFGTATQSNFDVSYILDGGATVTETFTGTLNGNSTALFSFTTTADLSAFGPHTIEASTLLAADFDPSNDTFTEQFNTIPIISTFPYIEDLEGLGGVLPLGWQTSGVLPWLLDSGGTPSGGTGPNVDNTLGDATGTYIYAEATGFNPGDQGIFTTAAFDISSLTAPTLDFFYHMFGADIGTLNVDVIDITNNTTTNVFTLTGQQQNLQGDPYLRARVDLTSFIGSIIQLQFTSIRGGGFQSDIAVDDVSIFQLPDNDLAIVNATAPLVANTSTISVDITNFGLLTQTGFDVSYQVNGSPLVTEQFTGSIARDETVTFTFATPVTMSNLGPANLDVSVQLPGDPNLADNMDNSEVLVLDIVNSFPYAESFEAGNGSWFNFQGVNSTFELGTPANTIIDAASDGTQAWVTNLTGNHNNNEQSTIVSPFFDFSTIAEPVILLDINYDIEDVFDGAILQSTTDNGLTWQNVGALGDLLNWYDNTLVNTILSFATPSTDAWSSTNGGYQLAIHLLDNLGFQTNVALRIVFASDFSITQEGFAFDNVRIGSDADLVIDIVCPQDISVSNDPGVCEAFVNVPQPTFSNAVGTVVLTNSFNGTDDASGVYPVGITEVTWEVTDDVGFANTCTMLVEVVDNEDPMISFASDTITVGNDPGVCGAVVDFPDPGTSDNCPLTATITQSGDQTLVAGNFVVCPPGPNSYLRVFDIAALGFAGDLEVESLDFGIEQTQGLPSVTANIYLYDPTTPLIFANLTLLASQDVNDLPDGDLFLLNVPFPEGTVIPGGSTVVVELFTDSGNAGPTLLMAGQPNNAEGTSYLASNGCGVPEPTDVDAVGLGDIDADWIININSAIDLQQTAGLPSGSVFPVGVTTNTYILTDLAGNTAEASFTVTVEDNEAPVVIGQNLVLDITTLGALNEIILSANDFDNGSTDNCGITSLVLSNDTFNCPNLNTPITLTLTATDDSGNSASVPVTVTFFGPDEDLDNITDNCDNELNPGFGVILGISPNGDGQNDTWVVNNILNFPDAIVQVFDRNGVEVFSAQNYQNDWGGNRDGNGDLLPVGAYYFNISFAGRNDVSNTNGWLYINY